MIRCEKATSAAGQARASPALGAGHPYRRPAAAWAGRITSSVRYANVGLIHATPIDSGHAAVAMMARIPVTKSPYAGGTARAAGSSGETTPGTKTLRPMKRRNV